MTMHVSGTSLLTVIEDLGRTGCQKYGVNVSGAMDAASLRIANCLVGNPENTGAVEITMMGPDLVFDEDVLIALTGADLAPTADGEPVPGLRPVALRAGTVLSFGRCRLGCRAYLAVSGGFDIPKVMGSESTYSRAGIGGFEGHSLLTGDAVPLKGATKSGGALLRTLLAENKKAAWPLWRAGPLHMTRSALAAPIRFTAGLQYREFTEESRRLLETETFPITAHSDRMGYRLDGEKLALTEPKEMISEMAALGTIQVPPEGHPIVLMAEHQTCAGYPEIGQVILPDVCRLAQLRPGDTARFTRISLEEAETIYLNKEKELRNLAEAIAFHMP